MPEIRNETFRRWFYARWGRENCVIAARTNRAEYPSFQQSLSIKAAWGGSERYGVDQRHLAVDDDSYLILNDARTYSSSLCSERPMVSFSIFFRPGMASEVAAACSESAGRLLDGDTSGDKSSPEFSEQIRPHDRVVSPVLAHILRHVDAGVIEEDWYEEQLYFLLRRMLVVSRGDRNAAAGIPACRASTRAELFRRIGLAANFINTHFEQPVGLTDIAKAAALSRFHCLRVFKSVYGKTPVEYLNDRRVRVAIRLLRDSGATVDDVAARVGFQNRSSLFRHFKRVKGAGAAV